MRFCKRLPVLFLLLGVTAVPAHAQRPRQAAIDRAFGITGDAMGPEERHEAVDAPLSTEGSRPEAADWLRGFQVDRQRFEYTTRLVREEDGISVYRVSYASPLTSRWPENNVVPAEYFTPTKADGKLPAAIFLDIKAGNAIVPRMLARAAARRGMAAMYVPMPGYGPRRPKGDYQKALDDDPALVVQSIRQTVMDVWRAKAILASRPEVDAGHIGICGVSLGGIMAALTAGVDGDFDRVVLILAGGDLAKIAFSENRETRRLRAALQAKGLDPTSAATLFASVEPLNFAARIRPERCLMINALNDEIIPRATTDALRVAIGNPKILWLPAGHYSAVTHFVTMQERAMEFLRGGEGASPDPGETMRDAEKPGEPAR